MQIENQERQMTYGLWRNQENIKNKPIEQIKKPKNTRKMKNYQNIQKEKLYNCDWKKKEDGDDQEEFFAC